MNAGFERRSHALLTRAITLLSSMLFLGCATPQLSSITAGEEISVVAAPGPDAAALIEVSNQVIGKYAGSAAAGGVLIGAQLAMVCGPFALFCVPVGAAVGGASGAVAGAVVGIAESPNADATSRLRDRVVEFARTHDPRADLVTSIAERARDNWTVVPHSAGTTLVVHLDGVGVHLLRDESAAVAIRVTIDVRRKQPGAEGGTVTKVFDYTGTSSPVSQWIEDRDDFVAENFSDAYRRVANMVYAELAR